FAIAAEPLIGSLKSCDQRSAPVAESSAKTVPPPLPAMTVPEATTGVPVKSPSLDWKLHALVSAAALAGDGPSVPPSRVFAKSFPYEGQSAVAGGAATASAVAASQSRKAVRVVISRRVRMGSRSLYPGSPRAQAL